MSIPENPLDRFRSYSYHHILLVSNSTEALKKLTNPDMSSSEEQQILDNLQLGKKISIPNDPNASFYVICDTRQNSYFSISDVSYSSTISAGNAGYANVLFGDLDITFQDASGVSLINYLNFISKDGLKINLHHCMFLLKTIFVGHTQDGTTETVYQNAIPMLMVDLQVEPSHAGSTLLGKFCPIQAGAVPYISDFSKIQDIAGVWSETNRLKDAIKDLEHQLNMRSRKWYKDLQVKITDASNEVKPATGFGKLVQFMITIPDNWDSFNVKGVHNEITESEFKETGERAPVETKGVQIGLQTTTEKTIIEAIETILKQSNEVQKLASHENREKENVKGYKIQTTITSDDNTITIHYDVVNYSIPNVKKAPADSNQMSVDNKPIFVVSDKNSMEFDYIFSGKNTDILNFAMKINNVNLFIADNLVIGDKATQEVNKDQTNKEGDSAKTNEKKVIMKMREKDPVIPPEKTASQGANMPWVTETDNRNDAVQARQQFIHNMSLAHGASSFDVILQIRGNPNLFRRFVGAEVLPHVRISDSLDTGYVIGNESFVGGGAGGGNTNFLSESDRQTYKKALKDSIVNQVGLEVAQENGEPTLLPFYVKVNIYGTDYDVQNSSANAFSAFGPYQKMWYQGYYLVTKIDHKFSSGQFTQDMMLSAIPMDLYGQETIG